MTAARVVNSAGTFAWYELITTDAAAATAFYTKVMGWSAQDASMPGRTFILFTAANIPICGLMELPEDARQQGAQPSWVGYVRVTDVDGAAERVTQLGGTVRIPPTDIPNISRFSVFSDPQSVTLAMLKPLRPDNVQQPADPGRPGLVGWHELLVDDGEKALAFYGEVFGWQKADAETTERGTYQLFSAGGQTIGGMLAKPPTIPAPFWLYYFNVDDIDEAAKRVMAGNGQILNGPLELPAGTWVLQCTDPQGAPFALEGKRGRNPIGYFERVGSRAPADPRARRWSW